jgi:hypothetical protein
MDATWLCILRPLPYSIKTTKKAQVPLRGNTGLFITLSLCFTALIYKEKARFYHQTGIRLFTACLSYVWAELAAVLVICST